LKATRVRELLRAGFSFEEPTVVGDGLVASFEKVESLSDAEGKLRVVVARALCSLKLCERLARASRVHQLDGEKFSRVRVLF
jgi:hypothetical protein